MTGKNAGFDFGLHDLPHRQRRDARNTRHSRSGRPCDALPRPTGRVDKASGLARTADGHKPIWPASISAWPMLRQAFHWALAHELCRQYDTIRLETLTLQGMKALWGRKVSDLGFGAFVAILHHVAATDWHGSPAYRPLVSLDQALSCLWPCQRLHHAARSRLDLSRVRDDPSTRSQCRHQYQRGRGIFLWGKTLSDWLRPAVGC